MNSKRAVITGLGIVSPYGLGTAPFRAGIREGRSATRRVTLFDPGDLPCQVAAEVPEFDPAAHLPRADLPRVGRIVPLALAAAREAFAAAQLEPERLSGQERQHIGVIIGSGAGAIDFAESQYEAYYRDGIHRVNPFAISSSVVGMVSSELNIRLGFTGRSHVLSNGCTSSSDAVGYALHAIQRGDHPLILTGGAEACITRGMMEGLMGLPIRGTCATPRPDFLLTEAAFPQHRRKKHTHNPDSGEPLWCVAHLTLWRKSYDRPK